MKKLYIYKLFERFWHWSQSALIMFLMVTGFEVHDSIHLFGYEAAVKFHRVAAYLLLGLIVFAIFWHFTTGEWRQYIPTTKKIREQVRFYTSGIFYHKPHPTQKSVKRKLNPLQVWVYLGFKVLIIPVVVISGLLYMYHKTINANNIVVISNFKLDTIAFWHTFGAWILLAFLLVHVYLTTTGDTPLSNIKSMITGYEEIPESKDEEPAIGSKEKDSKKKESVTM